MINIPRLDEFLQPQDWEIGIGQLTLPNTYYPSILLGVGDLETEITQPINTGVLPDDFNPLFPLGNPLNWDWEETKEIITKKIPLIFLSLSLFLIGIYLIVRSTEEGKIALKLATKI